MNDLTITRPARRAVPVDGLDRVLREGRRRRRRAVGGGGGVLALSVAGALLVAPEPAGRSSLQPATGPERTPSASAAPSAATGRRGPRGVAVPDTGRRTADPTPTAEPTASAAPSDPAAEPTPEPTRQPTGSPRPTDPPSGSPNDGPWHHPARFGEYARGQGPAFSTAWFRCFGAGAVTDESWCYSIAILGGGNDVPKAGAGAVVEFHVSLCNAEPADGPSHTVAFTGQQEFEVTVGGDENGAGARWTWSTGQVFAPEAHSRTLAPGRCVGATISWNGTDDLGAPLAAGGYRLRAVPLGADTHGPQAARLTVKEGEVEVR